MHIWLSLAFSRLDARAKIRKAVGCQSRPGHFGPIVLVVVFWLPGLVVRDTGLTS